MANERILVIEDEADIADVVRAYLEREGFVVEVHSEGGPAIAAAERELPALMIVDVGLPHMNGFEVYRKISETAHVPTIFLTGRGDEVDRIVGLELGADDYVVKPFSPRELVARVRAVLRRLTASTAPKEQHVLRVHDLIVDLDAYDVQRADVHVQLTPAEYRILVALAAEPGRVFTRAQLLDNINADSTEIYDRTLDKHIANLRAKIGDDPNRPRYIITVQGVGYKFVQ